MSDRSREAVLEAVLNTHQLHVSVIAMPEYCGSWFEDEPATARGIFHLIDRGVCCVRSAALEQPLQLGEGDLIVFPRGSAHTLCDTLDAPSPPDRFSALICGEFEFAAGSRNPMIEALPPSFVVRRDEGGAAFRDLAKVLSYSAQNGLLGQRVIMDKLADSLFVMAVCAYAQKSQDQKGLLAALADPRMAKALAAIHTEPGKDWRVDTLAQAAGMSRTSFSVEFTRFLGVAPFQYLTEWRIAEARRLLRDRRLSVAAVAERLGYQSEAAFRRTFKRIEGVGPGEVRRLAV